MSDCHAKPENPCFCSCHLIIVDDDFGSRPLFGCNECSSGQKLKASMEKTE